MPARGLPCHPRTEILLLPPGCRRTAQVGIVEQRVGKLVVIYARHVVVISPDAGGRIEPQPIFLDRTAEAHSEVVKIFLLVVIPETARPEAVAGIVAVKALARGATGHNA